MKTFHVTVESYTRKTVVVEAKDEDQAYGLVKQNGIDEFPEVGYSRFHDEITDIVEVDGEEGEE